MGASYYLTEVDSQPYSHQALSLPIPCITMYIVTYKDLLATQDFWTKQNWVTVRLMSSMDLWNAREIVGMAGK